MTAFTKENLSYFGGYIHYRPHGEYDPTDQRFVARLKYAATSSKGPYMTFLRKNFTVEEYFGRIDAGESPLTILESKGFLLSHIKKNLKRAGYPVTKAGFDQMIQDQIAARKAA